MTRQCISLCLILSFIFATLAPISKAQAQALLALPRPGEMVNVGPAYAPTVIKGITIHPENPFLFDFLIAPGQDQLSAAALKVETEKLAKYFLATLAVPDNDLWVNLSPYEKNRIIPQALGQTDMGRDLLAQDYVLKQITASLVYPEKELGKDFWNKVYAKAQQQFGNVDIPVNTFNKVWVVGDRAKIYVHNNSAMVVDAHYKVMLEEDYLATQKHEAVSNRQAMISSVVRDIVLPQLEHEVNTGKNFASLRQISNAIILASWYKKNLKAALLNQAYANQSKVNGISLSNHNIKQEIYEQYLQAYKKGVFNYIKETTAPDGKMVPRKYFSGGYSPAVFTAPVIVSQDEASRAMPSSLYAARVNMDPAQASTVAFPTGFKADAQNTVRVIEDLLGIIGNETFLENTEERIPAGKTQVFGNALFKGFADIYAQIREALAAQNQFGFQIHEGMWLVNSGSGVAAYEQWLRALKTKIETATGDIVYVQDQAMLSAAEKSELTALNLDEVKRIYALRFDVITRTLASREAALSSPQAQRNGGNIARDIEQLQQDLSLLQRAKSVADELTARRASAQEDPQTIWAAIKQAYALDNHLTPEQNGLIGQYKRGDIALGALLPAVQDNLHALTGIDLDITKFAALIDAAAAYRVDVASLLNTLTELDSLKQFDQGHVLDLIEAVGLSLDGMTNAIEVARFIVRQAGFNVGAILQPKADAAMTETTYAQLREWNNAILNKATLEDDRAKALADFFKVVNAQEVGARYILLGMLNIMTQLPEQERKDMLWGKHGAYVPPVTKEDIEAVLRKSGWSRWRQQAFDQWFAGFDAVRTQEKAVYEALQGEAMPKPAQQILNQQYAFNALALARLVGAITIVKEADDADRASVSSFLWTLLSLDGIEVLGTGIVLGLGIHHLYVYRPRVNRLSTLIRVKDEIEKRTRELSFVKDVVYLGQVEKDVFVAFKPGSDFSRMSAFRLKKQAGITFGRKGLFTLGWLRGKIGELDEQYRLRTLKLFQPVPSDTVLVVRNAGPRFVAWLKDQVSSEQKAEIEMSNPVAALAAPATTAPDAAMNGGIDLRDKNRTLDLQQEGTLDIKIDAAMIARYQREGLAQLHPKVLSLAPVENAGSIFGLISP